MKIERGMPIKKSTRQKIYKTVSGKVAYIATIGSTRIYKTYRELRDAPEIIKHLSPFKDEDRKDWLFDAQIHYEGGKMLYAFWPYKEEDGNLSVLQFKKADDLAKSMLEFVNLVFPYIFEDYKLLKMNEQRSQRMLTIRQKEKELVTKEIKEMPLPSPNNTIEYKYLSSVNIEVILNGQSIGNIEYKGMNKKTGWHTIVPKCRDKWRPRLYATYNSIEAAKRRIEEEYLITEK